MKFRVTLALAFCGNLDKFDTFEDEDDGDSAAATLSGACGSLTCVCRLPLPPLAAVEAHVRQIPAAEFVKYIAGSVSATGAKDARWLADRFAVEFAVETPLSAAGLLEELRLYDLEDGEYEAAADNGWTIQCDGRELGTTDFRQLPIVMEVIQ